MARKKAESSSSAEPVELTPGKILARKMALWGVVAALGVTSVGLAFSKLKRHVETYYATGAVPPAVVIKDQPAWMNPLLAEKIMTIARPVRATSSFDRSILGEVYDQLTTSPDIAPWIEELHEVRRVYGQRPGDTIEIDAKFRAPAALVHYNNEYWLVDSHGVQLPESIKPEKLNAATLSEDGKLVLRVVEGVRRRPNGPGQLWRGEDLQAGLELLRELHNKPFTEELVKVDVANYGGRVDASAAQLVLITRHGTEVRWGRRITDKDSYIAELDSGRKLQNLESIVQRYGRVDANQPWIDIRFDRVMVPKAAIPQGSATTASAKDSRGTPAMR